MRKSLLKRCLAMVMAFLMVAGLISSPVGTISSKAAESSSSTADGKLAFGDDDTTPRSSGEDLKPGTYTITANIYVPAAYNTVLGCNAFLSNPDNPFGATDDGTTDVNSDIPNKPRYNNATVTINEDGTATLVLPVRNAVFTLQNLGASDEIVVNEAKRSDADYGIYKGRVTELTLTLKNLSGAYYIDNCECFPVIFSNAWIVPLCIAVDFANTQTPTDYTFKDEARNMDITVSTNTDLIGAELQVTDITEGDVYNNVKTALSNIQVTGTSTEPEYKMYNFKITKDGQEVTLSDNSKIIVYKRYPTQDEAIEALEYENNSAAYTYNNGVLKSQFGETKFTDDYTDFYTHLEVNESGNVVFVTNAKDSLVKFNRTWTNNKEGLAVTYTSTLASSAVSYDDMYSAYSPIMLFSDLNREDDKTDVLGAYGNDKVGKIETYRMNIAPISKNTLNWGYKNHTSLSFSIPNDDDKQLGDKRVYYVTKYNGEVTLKKLPYTESDDKINIDIIPAELKSREQKDIMEQLGNAISDSTSESDTIGYIAVVYETNPYVDKSLVYNGQEQTGVYEGSAYTLSGTTKAVNAGTYTATATLKDGYVWTDGDTNKTKTIEWSIAKAKITAKYNNEVVDKAEDATYAVEVTGFVDGENAENAKGYKAPVVEKPQLNDNTHTYKLIPANGEADNYEFEYVEGILNVGLKAVDKPSCDSNKYYDGKDTDFVEANAGYKRTGDYHGKNAGKYSFNVRLNEGYVWSDGTSDDIEFNISIRKRNLKLVYEDVTTEYGVYPTELKFKVADEQIIWQPSGLAEGETLEGLIESGELKYLGISNSSYGWETTDENNDIKCNIKVSDNDFEAVNYDIYNGSPSGIWTQKSIAKTLDNGKTTFNDKKIAEIVEEINNAKDGDTIAFYAPVYVDIIPSEILEAAKGKDINFNISVFYVQERQHSYSWIFNGKAINNTENEPFPKRLYYTSEYTYDDYVTSDMISKFIGETTYDSANDYQSAIKYEGSLPCNIEFDIFVSELGSMKYLTVAYTDWDKDNTTLTPLIGQAVNKDDGYTVHVKADKSGVYAAFRSDYNYAAKRVDIPEAVTGLIYNGKEQTGVAEGEGYTLSDNAKATEAGTYTVTATLEDGRLWSDGSVKPKEITYTIELAKEEPTPAPDPTPTPDPAPDDDQTKEYTVTANLSVPGELNTQLPGVTAYMTNPDNPLGIVPDGYDSVNSVAPTTPVSNNAKLKDNKDGTYTLTLNVPNPVFTLQKIGNSTNAEIVSSVRDNKTYSGNTGVSRNGRITQLTIKLKDKSGTYIFNDCTEFPTLLETDWNVPLTLSVEFPADDNKNDDNKDNNDKEQVDTSNITVVSDVEKETADTPVISVKGISTSAKEYFKSLITKDDIAKLAEAGNKLELKLTAENVTNTISEADKKLIADKVTADTALDGAVVGQYVDINAELSALNKKITEIPNSGTITLSVKLDNSLINKAADRTYYVVRLHKNSDGSKTAQVINTTFDSVTGSVKFDTDRFSTYAIVYKDAKTSDDIKDPGNNGSDDANKDSSVDNGSTDNNTPDTDSTVSDVNSDTTADTVSEAVSAESVATADTSNMYVYILIMMAAVASALAVVSRKKAK